MSKKDFIALADALVRFCKSQNYAFKEERWRAYLAGDCGPNGGPRKAAVAN